jgi:ABC-type oligopeptide transport system ATPase subunit
VTTGTEGHGQEGDTDVLLDVEDLRVHYGTRASLVKAVDGVTFQVRRGEIVGLVGESGSGKSTLGRAIVRLERMTGGKVRFDGEDVSTLQKQRLKQFRRRAQMVFQDPFSSLNPRMTIGSALEEPLLVHRMVPRDQRRRRAGDLLEMVGLDPAHLDRFPHEFSGGQRQRIGIARAMSVSPNLIVADEPVSALDVTVQAQVLELIRSIRRDHGCAFLFIAHDLAVVKNLCTRVLVMHRGKIVEAGDVETVYARPQNEYTRNLLEAVPDIEKGLAARSGDNAKRTTPDF